MTRPRSAVALALVPLLALTACGGGGADTSSAAQGDPCTPLKKKETVTISFSSANMAFAAPLLAKQVGAYEKENLDVRFTKLPAADAIAPLAQSRVDATLSTLNAGTFNAMASGVEIRWIAPLYTANPEADEGLWVTKKVPGGEGDAFDVSGLKGRTVSTPTGLGGTATFILAERMFAKGMSFKDVRYQQMGAPDIFVALRNGSIDGGWLSDPFWRKAKAAGLRYVGGYPEAQNGTAILAGPGLRDRPAVAGAFLRAIRKTTEQYLKDGYLKDAKTRAALAKALEVPEEELAGNETPHVFDPKLKITDGADFATRMQQAFKKMGGLLDYDEPLPADKVIDTSVNDALAKCS